MENQYDSMTLANLRELAKEKGLKNITSYKKKDLIEALLSLDSNATVKPVNTEVTAEKIQASVNGDDAVKAVSEDKVGRIYRQAAQTTESVAEQAKSEYSKAGHTRDNIGKENVTRSEAIKTEAGITEKVTTDRGMASRTVTEQSISDKRAAEQGAAEQQKPEAMQDAGQGAGRDDKKLLGHTDIELLDSGETKVGILEVLPDGYGFIRCDNYLPGENDVYVSPAQIRRFNLKTGDIVTGNTRIKSQNEKFSALLYVKSVNGFHPNEAQKRKRFEDLTPIFPNERIHLETPGAGVAMRMVDLISPIGKGQRGMIVSQPKTGKTTLLKQIAKAVTRNHPEMKLIILLIDERPEEVTDIKESIEGKNVEVIYSTFDELPENHKRVSEMVIERAKRLVEHKQDVIILLDSITRLARAYNLTVQPSGRTLSGGLDPAALHMPKRFFGAARNMREGGSLTILATALVDTGSRMDDVVFEEFKGTGNMELVLDRSLSEKRIFPAIDLPRSSTRREDLLLTQPELEATYLMRKALGGMKSEEALERIIDMFLRTKTNSEFIEIIKKTKIVF